VSRRELVSDRGGARLYRVIAADGRPLGTDLEADPTPNRQPGRLDALEARVAALEAARSPRTTIAGVELP
jgi:hypothetical protein